VIAGQAWTHRIWNKTGTAVIDSIGLNAGATDSFLVRAYIPALGQRCDSSRAQVIATSRQRLLDDILADTVQTISKIRRPNYTYYTIPYSWVEINPSLGGSGTNAGISGDDMNGGPYPIGFAFPYYNCEQYSSVRMCTNGWASFTSTSTVYTNSCLPNATEPYNGLCIFWDDMSLPSQTAFYWYDATNSRFIMEWYQNTQLSGGGSFTFEIILYADGTIDYMYNTMTNGTTLSNTVGIQNSTSTVAVNCWCNGTGPLGADPTSGLGIRFGLPPDYMVDVSPLLRSGGGTPGDSVDYLFTIANGGLLNDTYNLSVAVASGQAWVHQLWNKTGTAQISSIAVSAGVIDSIKVRAFIPSGAGQFDSSYTNVVARSVNAPMDNIYADTSHTLTKITPWRIIPLSWVEIAGTAGGPGTSAGISGDDMNGGPFPIGFSFPWYNCVFYNTVRMCTNGWASFTSALTSYYEYGLPSASMPFDLLAPFFDDMTLASTSNAWYYYDATNNRFIMEWYQATQLSGGGSFTFEIILHPSGAFEFMYYNMTYGTTLSNTVGIQNGNGTVGIQCTYDGSGPLPDPYTGLGIGFNPLCVPAEWCVDLTPETQTSPITPGGHHSYTITALNCGTNTDVYSLSTANVPAGWTATILDQTGTTVIDSIGPMVWLESYNFKVRMDAPGGALPGSYATDVIAQSRYNVVVDTVQVVAAITPQFTLPFCEDFQHGGANPDWWTIVDGGSVQGGSATWHAELDTSLVNYVELSDADGEGSSATQDEQLITPIIDCSGAPVVFLSFWQYYYYYSADTYADVDISISGGAWQTVFHNTSTSPAYGEIKLFNISSWAANQSSVQLRFHYVTAWGFWWLIDNVCVYAGELWADAGTACIRVTPLGTGSNDCSSRLTGTSYDVWTTIENAGTATADVTVNAHDNLGWTSTRTILGMTGGTCTEVRMPTTWVGGAAGTLNTITVTAVAAGDTIPGNNTLTKAVTVPQTGGTTMLIDDGTMYSAWRFYDPINNIFAAMYTPESYPVLVNWVAACIYGLSWPDATNDQWALSIWLEDPYTPGYPAEPPVWTELNMYSDGGTASWAYTSPNIPVMITDGSFWVGFHEPNSCASVGNEGICEDAAYTYPAQNWYRIAGVWSLDASRYGDIMLHANVVAGAVAAVNDLVIEVYEVIDEANTVRLSWSSVTGAAEYKIYKSYDPTSGYTLVDSTMSTTWIEPDALVGTEQSFYYVTADNVHRGADTGGAAVLSAPVRNLGPIAPYRSMPAFWSTMHDRIMARPCAASSSSPGQHRTPSSSVRTK
jgi:hypothetical protein